MKKLQILLTIGVLAMIGQNSDAGIGGIGVSVDTTTEFSGGWLIEGSGFYSYTPTVFNGLPGAEGGSFIATMSVIVGDAGTSSVGTPDWPATEEVISAVGISGYYTNNPLNTRVDWRLYNMSFITNDEWGGSFEFKVHDDGSPPPNPSTGCYFVRQHRYRSCRLAEKTQNIVRILSE